MPYGLTYKGPDTDPGADLVEELLRQLEAPAAPERQGPGLVRGTFGALGDALTAMASVRAGGAPPQIGSFAATQRARERDLLEQQRAAADEMRKMRNMIRVRDFQDRREAALSPRRDQGTSHSEKPIVITQDLIDQGIAPPEALDKSGIIRDVLDEATGETIRREFVGLVPQGTEAPKIERFAVLVTPDFVKNHPSGKNFKGLEGQYWTARAVVDPKTGVSVLSPEAPAKEPVTLIETPQGFVRVGQATGDVDPLVGPDGQPLTSVASELKRIKLDNDRKMALRGKMLDAGTRQELSKVGSALESTAWASRRYAELGEPQMWVSSQLVTSKEAKAARAALTAAFAEVRKALSGSAVSESEAKYAEALIVRLDGAVTADTLKAGLVELANMMLTKRRRLLLDAQKSGTDISGFERETAPVRYRDMESMMLGVEEMFEGGEGTEAPQPESRTVGGTRFVVDENGQIKVKEE